MSTEQEILGAEFMGLVEVKLDLEKQVRELTHRLDIALESEVACAEQRQRADMAEEREKRLLDVLEDVEGFLETVLQWTGSDPDELDETQDIVRRALNA